MAKALAMSDLPETTKPPGTGGGVVKGPSEGPGEEGVVSGRMVTALAIVLAMVMIPISGVGRLIEKKSPKSETRERWAVGKEAEIMVTTVTADFENLTCKSERSHEGLNCAFRSDKERFPLPNGAPLDDNKANELQPYRTTDSQLVLMNGMWATPEIAQRLHDEPSRGVQDKKLARFVVACRVKFVAEWPDAEVRWKPREPWSKQGSAMVARTSSCRIVVDEGAKNL